MQTVYVRINRLNNHGIRSLTYICDQAEEGPAEEHRRGQGHAVGVRAPGHHGQQLPPAEAADGRRHEHQGPQPPQPHPPAPRLLPGQHQDSTAPGQVGSIGIGSLFEFCPDF